MNIEDAMEIVHELHEDEGAGDPEAMINISPSLLFALEAELVKQLDALEVERQRLTACGVAALGWFKGCVDEYKSASLSDVLRLRAKLRWFEEREPLVQAMLTALWECPNDDAIDEMCPTCVDIVERIKAFPCISSASTDAALAAPKSSDEPSPQ